MIGFPSLSCTGQEARAMNENGCVGLSTLMGLQWPHKIPSCVPTEKGGAPESRPKSGVREAKRTMLGEAQRLELKG